MSVDVGPEEAHARAERGNARLAVAAVFFLHVGERDDTAHRRHARVRGSVSPKREIGAGEGWGFRAGSGACLEARRTA
jgi:hypothetical protein